MAHGQRGTSTGTKDAAKRARLLELLGRQNAFVLGGHIHKFSAIARATPGGGRFAQLAVSSVIGTPDPVAKELLTGIDDYNDDQILVEPRFSPDTEPERRAVYDAEQPVIRAFQYANLPGYAVVTIDGPTVQARIFPGVSRQAWRTVELSKLLTG